MFFCLRAYFFHPLQACVDSIAEFFHVVLTDGQWRHDDNHIAQRPHHEAQLAHAHAECAAYTPLIWIRFRALVIGHEIKRAGQAATPWHADMLISFDLRQ